MRRDWSGKIWISFVPRYSSASSSSRLFRYVSTESRQSCVPLITRSLSRTMYAPIMWLQSTSRFCSLALENTSFAGPRPPSLHFLQRGPNVGVPHLLHLDMAAHISLRFLRMSRAVSSAPYQVFPPSTPSLEITIQLPPNSWRRSLLQYSAVVSVKM